MKTNRLLWLMAAPFLMVPFSSGCMFLKAPEPDPTPTPAPTPKAPYFDPTAGMATRPTDNHLNKADDLVLPDTFHMVDSMNGQTVTVQSLNRAKAGAPLLPGQPEVMRLAGVVTPSDPLGQLGVKAAIDAWTKSKDKATAKDLDIDQDPKYPIDLTGHKLIQIYFTGGDGPYKGQPLSLNRMLIRSGWAVVDLYSPTSFDTSQWYYDEAHARIHRLGYWKYGKAIQQRVPVPIPVKGTGALSKVNIVKGKGTPTAATGKAAVPATAGTPTTAAPAAAPAATLPSPAAAVPTAPKSSGG